MYLIQLVSPLFLGCAARPFPCDEGCTCVDIEHTHKCDCPVTLGVVGDGSVPARKYSLSGWVLG